MYEGKFLVEIEGIKVDDVKLELDISQERIEEKRTSGEKWYNFKIIKTRCRMSLCASEELEKVIDNKFILRNESVIVSIYNDNELLYRLRNAYISKVEKLSKEYDNIEIEFVENKFVKIEK